MYCFYCFLLDIFKKKKALKMKKSSKNDQLTGHFQSFFIYFFLNQSSILEYNF